LPVPEKVEKYLKTRFGDYLSIPEKNIRKVASHVKYVDLETDYRSFI
jgi:hypothetical protein